MESKPQENKYVGKTGTEGYDGYAGLQLGKSYKGEEKQVPGEPREAGGEPVITNRVVIALPNGRTTSVSPEQWREWFTFG